jgi:glutamate-1-semialdehyde aminotransferase
VFDEIRTGFRVAMGGAQERYGVVPDLTTVGKAMANGYAISAVVGKRDYMQVMEKKAFVSSTFFPNSLEIVAALKTIDILERERVPEKLWERGTRFNEGLARVVAASGQPIAVSGVPVMPFLTFDRSDPVYKERRTRFYTECIRRGLFVQPYHHWYINYRHTEQDLDRAVEVVEAALAATADGL